jgi:hypothetical protein
MKKTILPPPFPPPLTPTPRPQAGPLIAPTDKLLGRSELATLHAAAVKPEKLVLRIVPPSDLEPGKPGERRITPPQGRVTLDVEDVERDKNGTITAFTVSGRQTVKVFIPRGRFEGFKLENEDREKAKEEIRRRLQGPP